jgi:ParB family transcriptional regulator, chromosome partitioning protein
MAEKSTKTRHLGRGLEALLGPISSPDPTERSASKGDVPDTNLLSDNRLNASFEIPITAISPNPHQVRKVFDEGKLDELASSIRANGIVQPVVVRKGPAGYQLIAGERRFRASQSIGLKTIPAFVRSASEEQMLEFALVENIHRADLNPLERAKAYKSYVDQFGLTQTEAAKKLGEDRSVVSNHLRLLDLPQDLCQLLVEGQLTMGHAKAILSLPTEELRRKLANRALSGRLNVRELERIVREYTEGKKLETADKKAKDKAPHIVELEGRLSQELGSRVKIETKKNGQRGKMVIEFRTLDEFDQVLEKLGINCHDEI